MGVHTQRVDPAREKSLTIHYEVHILLDISLGEYARIYCISLQHLPRGVNRARFCKPLNVPGQSLSSVLFERTAREPGAVKSRANLACCWHH